MELSYQVREEGRQLTHIQRYYLMMGYGGEEATVGSRPGEWFGCELRMLDVFRDLSLLHSDTELTSNQRRGCYHPSLQLEKLRAEELCS